MVFPHLVLDFYWRQSWYQGPKTTESKAFKVGYAKSPVFLTHNPQPSESLTHHKPLILMQLYSMPTVYKTKKSHKNQYRTRF